MAGKDTGGAQQFFLDDGGVRSGNSECGGLADGCDCACVMPQSLQFTNQDTENRCARRRLDRMDFLHGLTKGERVCKRGGCREALGEQQHIRNASAFGKLFHGAIVIEKTRHCANHVFTNRLQQKVH